MIGPAGAIPGVIGAASRIPPGGGIDPEAAAFLTAANITDPVTSGAVDTLVVALKAAGVWAAMKAVYPFVGGTAATHKLNLKDPRDLDVAFRLSFQGGWTHDAGGALPDGAGGAAATTWADTHVVASTEMTTVSGCMGFYSRTDNALGFAYDIGCCDGGDAAASIVVCRYGNNATYLDFGTGLYPSAPSSDGRGFFVANRLGVSNTQGYKNGEPVFDAPDAVTLVPQSFFIGACNKGGTPAYAGAKQCAFAMFSSGLTAPEHTDLYLAVQAFQTALSRAV